MYPLQWALHRRFILHLFWLCPTADFYWYLNDINHNMKLSLDFSMTSINFWDLKIYVDAEGTLHTTVLYTGRTPTEIPDSFHPTSLISNSPYRQFQRLRQIRNSDTDFETQSTEMYECFKQREATRLKL